MPSDQEMLERLKQLARGDEVAANTLNDFRWAVKRIERLEGALAEVRAECARSIDCNHPGGNEEDDDCDGEDCIGCTLTCIVDAVLFPSPAKEGVWVRLPQAVRSELPWSNTVAPPGVYLAESNPHGALSVRATDGTMLGIKPGEFERIDAPAKGTEAQGG